MAFAENLSPFFSLDGFAVAATLAGASVVGILDLGYTDAFGGVVAGFAPTFTLPTASCTSTHHGDVLVVSGKTYKVRGIEPDGTGVTMLKLEEQ